MLYLFTGKGGVGKTTVSSATALHHAGLGKRTLLVSSDPAHSTDDVLQCKVGNTPTKITDNLDAMNINAETQAKEFMSLINDEVKGMMGNVPGFDPDMFMDMAGFPGMDEYFGMELIHRYMKSEDYEVIVFDTAPTGHTMKMLTAPDAIRSFILRILRMKTKIENIKGFIFRKKSQTEQIVKELEAICERIDEFKELLSSSGVSINLVSIATEAGYQECARTLKFLHHINIPVRQIIINNIIPDFGEEVWASVDKNPASALTHRNFTIQQPYIEKYRNLVKENKLRMIGLTVVPFEPIGIIPLTKFATLVWKEGSGMK
tara:strand:+ start:791 stop:1744 length:954 start_codon:yes stop_codon:yes gene_type:complete